MKYYNLILVLSFVFCFSACKNFKSSNFQDDAEYEEIEEEEMIDCPSCKGRGYFTHQCDVCEGKGVVVSGESVRETRTCSTCNGMGKLPCAECDNYGYHFCSNCDGYMGQVMCQACNGAGRFVRNIGGKLFSTTCGLCNGNGYVNCPVCNGNFKITCRTCHGEGIRICPTCQGSGGPDRVQTQITSIEDCPNCNGTGKTQSTCEECDGVGLVKVQEFSW